MAGNGAVLKHASNVPRSALAIAQIFQDAGLPQGVFQTLLIEASQVATVIADERIKAATLTGSEAAGQSLAEHGGRSLKKVVLELGGSDPFIVLPSADLELAVATAVTARLLNNGQSCIAAKRFIVAEAIADEFTQRLVEKFAKLHIGDPMQPETDVGPLATPAILQDLDRQVQAAIAVGAKVLIGGKPLAGVGNFYPPTILADIAIDNPIAQEEFFGPVALVFRVPDLTSAIELANSTPFGLGASAWTQNESEQQQLIQEIEAGSVFINGMVKSDPRLPFGGIKRSGFGRELGKVGIHEFVNIKTVWVK
jgi:succinate-semialdehyde dehydrogenase/glutarate-semialdehyde dehydrogenase